MENSKNEGEKHTCNGLCLFKENKLLNVENSDLRNKYWTDDDIKEYYIPYTNVMQFLEHDKALNEHYAFINIMFDEMTKEEQCFKRVPGLEIDGLKLGQSIGIISYVGNEFGLHGDSVLENAQIKEEQCFKRVPGLEIDGLKLGQSIGIISYVGNEFGLHGDSVLENAQTKEEQCFKRVPGLEIDGLKLGQSIGIISYVGNEFGLHGRVSEVIADYQNLVLQTRDGSVLIEQCKIFIDNTFCKFLKIKEEQCFKRVPGLEIDGLKLGQSIGIISYVGNEFGLHGDSVLENAQVLLIF
uniref:GST N-terminal domain-containing protein n=1 Tax=Rhabditophanes sp. KR3021 TaxID=114890 RepID=A0AC35U0T4_9BILA